MSEFVRRKFLPIVLPMGLWIEFRKIQHFDRYEHFICWFLDVLVFGTTSNNKKKFKKKQQIS